MNDQDLPPTTDSILLECPKFRILVLGRSGAGKTTLIRQAFGIDILQSSHQRRGRSNIEDELFSPNNDRFIVHDSEGFEPGELKNFKIVKDFIDKRNREEHIKDRVHAVWHCIQIPPTGGRVFETGDENFLKLDLGNIPVTVVFTQFDKLVNQIEFKIKKSRLKNKSKEEIKDLIESDANDAFEEICVHPLNRLNPKLHYAKVSTSRDYLDTCTELIGQTSELIEHFVNENSWFLSAIAQRADVDLKIKASIRLGMKKYWRDLNSSTHFDGKPLIRCLVTIQQDILNIWNFSDDSHILIGNEFKAMLLRLIQDLGDPNSSDQRSAISQDIGPILAELDAAGSPSNRPAPAFDWLFGTYRMQALPAPTLCTLMGFIVDLTMVLERLFWIVFRRNINTVNMNIIHEVFTDYNGSGNKNGVHQAIRAYVANINPTHHDEAHQEVARLIKVHRSVSSRRKGKDAAGKKGCFHQ